jgi:hypothetical protein
MTYEQSFKPLRCTVVEVGTVPEGQRKERGATFLGFIVAPIDRDGRDELAAVVHLDGDLMLSEVHPSRVRLVHGR